MVYLACGVDRKLKAARDSQPRLHQASSRARGTSARSIYSHGRYERAAVKRMGALSAHVRADAEQPDDVRRIRSRRRGQSQSAAHRA